MIESREQIEPADSEDWRAWLADHHADSPGCWVVLAKRGQPGLGYVEAVEEALCFGWIDGRMQPIDDGRFRQHFAPRKRGGTWARSNRERVERLEASGRMTDAGRSVINKAKADGSWQALESVEALEMPDDLEAALADNPTAVACYRSLAPSAQRAFLWWIVSAKRAETRRQRVQDSVWLLERGFQAPRRVRQ